MPEPALRDEPLRAPKLDETGRSTEEKADKADRYGEWLADEARIWRVYGQLAKEDDKEKAQRWSGGLNNLAVFAALFSGITTAFLIESQNDLKPDFAELAYRVQNATAHGRPYVEEPFVVPGQARLVNCLWITSLLLSLSAALIAIMGQDWVEMYLDKPVCNPRQWAEIRSFRLNGVRRWRMPGVIATAPVLLHVSLFLFGIGLVIFMTSDVITQNLSIALCAVIAFLYSVTMFSPVLWSSSPFRSPATVLLREWFCAGLQSNDEKTISLAENATILHVTGRIAAARRWIQNRFSMHLAAFDIGLEIYGLHVSNGGTAVFRRWSRRQGINDGGSLPPSRTGHDPEAAAPVAEPQHAGPGWPPNLLSRFHTASNPILLRFGPKVSNRWTAFRQWCTATHHRSRGPVLAWISNRFTNFLTAFGRILDHSRPDLSNGWLDIGMTPSPALVADSLSWLSSASSSPEVTQLIVAGLCDHVIGPQVAGHAHAQRLIQKLSQYADGHWEHMTILDQSRYVIIAANAGQRDWPDRVKKRFTGIIDADTQIPQDFLLALIHLTSGFRHEPLQLNFPLTWLAMYEQEVTGFSRLCERIQDCCSIALQAMLPILAWPTSEYRGNSSVMTLLVLMNKWRYTLPPDLRPVERVLREMLPNEAVEQANKLATLCQSRVDRPVDTILHLLIAFFSGPCGKGIARRLIRGLTASLIRAASGSIRPHSCLAVMFGNSDPHVTKAAWSDIPAHDIQLALHLAIRHIFVHGYHADLQPVVARMIARCIEPPFPLLRGDFSPKDLLFHGAHLFQIIEAMSEEHVLPDDLFRPVLEFGALVKFAAFLPEAPAVMDSVSHFFRILGAIALWIKAQSDVEDRLKLFELFTAHQTICPSAGAVWDLADAVGIALTCISHKTVDVAFTLAVKSFMSVMKDLRMMSLGTTCTFTLWADLAVKFGADRNCFSEGDWPSMREAVKDATGVDPGLCPQEDWSCSQSVAAPGVDSISGSSETVKPANPASQIAWIAAGATPEDAI